MERVGIASSTLASVGYDARFRLLEVEFRDTGHVYEYIAVPPAEYQELMQAGSIGGYFNFKIKPRYECRRLE